MKGARRPRLPREFAERIGITAFSHVFVSWLDEQGRRSLAFAARMVAARPDASVSDVLEP